ncbi:MAG: Ig-like domain-containing protein, partial [Gemmataceae bacterium]
DQNTFLNEQGKWQSASTWAINTNDGNLTAAGLAGVARPSSYTGSIYFDDFLVKPLSGSESPPSVLVQAAQSNGVMTGVAAVQASVVSTIPLSRVEFFVDNVLYDTANKANPAWNLDTRILSNGSHLLTVRAYDQSGLSGEGSLTVVVQNDKSPLARPTFPQKFSHIRLANLAYGALGPTEEQFLRQRTDLVIMDYHPGTRMEKVESVSPDTPQLLYTNVSNLYRDLLTDWLEFADRKGYSREGAFFHVTKATPFSGDGASTQPVNWFWSAWMTSLGKQTDVTTALRGTSASGTLLPSTGQSLLVGQPDRFREINVNLVSGASEGWSGMLEYPTAVDLNGRPTAWAPLCLLQDGTAGWTTTGRITFDPPANWKASRAQDGSPLLYMVRLRNTLPGTAPVARSILGRDYFSVGSSTSGVIPAFDHAADLDRDGYLNDTEYARRAQGFDARFVHESRVFTYGPMRFSSNPRDLGFKAWAVDYHLRYLNKFPLADGLFVDNSGGASPVKPDAVRERTEFY